MTEPDLGEIVRNVHRRYPTGVSVVTVTASDGKPYGLAVNSFSSVSLDPPLILFAVNVSASSYPWMFAADHMAVNVLSTSQTAVSSASPSPAVTSSPTSTGRRGRPAARSSPVAPGSSSSPSATRSRRTRTPSSSARS